MNRLLGSCRWHGNEHTAKYSTCQKAGMRDLFAVTHGDIIQMVTDADMTTENYFPKDENISRG